MARVSDTAREVHCASEMELRLYRLLCLSASVLSVCVIIPINIALALSPEENVAILVFAGASYFLYRAAGRGRYHPRTLLILQLLLLDLIWFSNGGSQGSISFYFFPSILYAVTFFRGRQRCVMLAFCLVNASALFGAEQLYPEMVVSFRTQGDRLGDLVTGFLESGLICALMLWVVLSDYDSEQKRLRALVNELRDSIEERQQAELALQENEDLRKAILGGTPDAMYAKDIYGRYILVNHGFEAATCRSAQESLGKDDTFLFPPERADQVMERDLEVVRTGRAVTFEESVGHGAAGTRCYLTTIGPIFSDKGEVTGSYGIARDVTELKKAEQEIRQLNKDLDARVKERTARLEAAMREQEAFSYSVSHDLRSPLRHMNSYCSIIEEECGSALPAVAKGYLGKVRAASAKLGKLIDELLEMSRISRCEVRREAVDLSASAREVSVMLRETEPKRKVQFVIAEGIEATGDGALLRLVMENLLGNAWKYTSHKEEARIEVGSFTRNGHEIYFVRDNGTGFDMSYKDNLFGAFQRLHGPEYEGTGIGLATVKRIVERHQGMVWADAKVGHGATIYFSIGTHARGNAEPEGRGAASTAAAAVPQPGSAPVGSDAQLPPAASPRALPDSGTP